MVSLYKTDYSCLSDNLDAYWNRLLCSIDYIRWKEPYTGSLYASISFGDPSPSAIDCEVLTLAFLLLIEKYAYRIETSYMKITLGYRMQLPSSADFSFTLCKALPLCDEKGNRLNKRKILSTIEALVISLGERYIESEIKGVFIHLYFDQNEANKKIDFPTEISSEIAAAIKSNIINVLTSDKVLCDLPEVKSLKSKESRIPTKMNAIKTRGKACRSFIVADIETVLVNSVHVPYAAGYLVVHPGSDLTSLPSHFIETFYSENIHIYPNPQRFCKSSTNGRGRKCLGIVKT